MNNFEFSNTTSESNYIVHRLHDFEKEFNAQARSPSTVRIFGWRCRFLQSRWMAEYHCAFRSLPLLSFWNTSAVFQEPIDILSLFQFSRSSEARNSARPTGEKCQSTKRISCVKYFSRLRLLPLRYCNLPKPKEFSWITRAASPRLGSGTPSQN